MCPNLLQHRLLRGKPVARRGRKARGLTTVR
jgi:hypothetical protein